MEQGTIRVEGRASRWVAADHVDVTLTVSRRADTTAAAVEAASADRAVLDTVLVAHADAVARRTTTSLVVQEVVRFEPETGRQVPEGFVASRVEVVRFAPVAAGGAVLQHAVAAVAGLGVSSPTFGVAHDHPVHAEVRAAAAADARASALAYASGVGLGLGAVQRLSEPRPDRGGQPYGDTSLRMLAKAGAPDGGETVLVELTAEDVEVTAAVELIVALA